VADTTDLDAVDALMETVRDPHGRLDALFANAGTGTFLPFENITEQDFDQGVDVNFKGVFFTVQKALPLLADGAAVVINASWTPHRGNGVLRALRPPRRGRGGGGVPRLVRRVLCQRPGPRGRRRPGHGRTGKGKRCARAGSRLDHQ
jgi:NAD(P)-dependent dehydrogenase (short-subunit alcohol dehydrogenase family)